MDVADELPQDVPFHNRVGGGRKVKKVLNCQAVLIGVADERTRTWGVF
jgi:hypothetical protein